MVVACVPLLLGIPDQYTAAQGGTSQRVTLGAGAGVMEFDAYNDQAFRGVALRGGVAASWFLNTEVVTQYWPDLGVWRGGSVVAEGTFFPVGHPRLAPLVQAGLGYFRATDRGGFGFRPIAGVTTTFGVGVEGRVSGPWSVRLDANVRFDPGSFDDEIRLSLTHGVGLERPASLPGGTVQASIYALAPLTGPWHPVEPGYGLSFATPVAERHDVALDVVLVHWHAADNPLFSGWDTRAVFLLPALTWVSGREGLRWRAGVGPLGTLMVEGPDDGLRPGAHAVVGADCRVGGGLVASLDARFFWMVREPNPGFSGVSQLPAMDERGLLLRLGVGF
jgi:hypothetical protein